jgi:hypothetical protein
LAAGSAQPAPPQSGPGPRAESNEWGDEKFERQEFREEMESIRKDHEDLERARDKLLDKCVNAKGDQVAACEKDKQALHEWHDRLHARLMALREKIAAARKEKPQGMQEGPGIKPWTQSNTAPQAAPATPSHY